MRHRFLLLPAKKKKITSSIQRHASSKKIIHSWKPSKEEPPPESLDFWRGPSFPNFPEHLTRRGICTRNLNLVRRPHRITIFKIRDPTPCVLRFGFQRGRRQILQKIVDQSYFPLKEIPPPKKLPPPRPLLPHPYLRYHIPLL